MRPLLRDVAQALLPAASARMPMRLGRLRHIV